MNNILSALADAKTVIIAGHTHPDGDCIGSCMGLYHYIREQYPEIEVDVRLESVPESFRVIPGTEFIKTTYDDEKQYDLFIALDASDEARLAQADRYFSTARHTICIDHHISNQGYADENLIQANVGSTGEIITSLLDMDKISNNSAIALYVAMICDTGVFKYSQTSLQTMTFAGRLMEKGIPFTELIDGVFYSRSFKQNKLIGQCLLDSRLTLDGRMIISTISKETLDSYQADRNDVEGAIDQLRLTKGVEVAVMASATVENGYKFSLRSNKVVDVSKICAAFGGGGHIRAAGFSTTDDLNLVCQKVEQMVKEQLEACMMA